MAVIILALSCADVLGQITSPNAGSSQPTQYTNGMPDDEIFIFCSPDANGNPIQGSLTATPTIAGPGFNFEWGLYDANTHSYPAFFTENGVATSTVNNLASGGYQVTITNNGGQTETFITWVYVSALDADINIITDPVNPGCEPFEVQGTVSTTDFTYWDPVDPGAAPFIVDASTEITVCFSANHTYVSDLGFYLVGPPSCGSPTVLLSPNPGANGQGPTCNSNNNVNNLCFTTVPSGNFNPCNQLGNFLTAPNTNSNYTGTYSSYGPDNNITQINWSPIYGCNSAEGGWAVQIYDCIAQDVGALTNATISFSDGTSTISYASGNINSAINDNSCTPQTASIFVVPISTPVDPDPHQVPNTGTITYQLGVAGSPVTLPPGTDSFSQTIDPIPTNDEWYYLEITDNFGCSAVDSVMFAYSGSGTAAIDDINPGNLLCSGSSAVQLTAASPGGDWTGNGVNASGLFNPTVAGTGTHTITYTIPPPCGDVGTIDITVGDLGFTVASTDAVCAAENGTATVTPTSGSAPFTFVWNTTPVQNDATATGLAAGDYEVEVTSSEGCSGIASVTVGLDAGDLDVSMAATSDMSCNGVCDGTAEVNVTGGADPVSILWDDPDAQTGATAVGLCAGIFNVTVTDGNDCSITLQAEIAEPDGMTANAVMTAESDCGQPTGEAQVTASGGEVAGDYDYEWDTTPVQTTATATGLASGQYTVTVSDDNGCSVTANVTVTGNATFSVNILSQTDALCAGECNGAATVAADADAVLPIAYSWNTTPVQTAATATDLCEATYTVNVTDDTGCMASTTVTIGGPQPLTVTAFTDVETLCIGQTAVLSATVDGGSGAVNTLFWTADPSDPSLDPDLETPSVSPAVSTAYTVVATDSNGCTSAPASIGVSMAEPLSLAVIQPLGADTAVCAGETVLINLAASGGDGDYSFAMGGIPVNLPLAVTPWATTVYGFTVGDGCGTPEAAAEATVTVHPIPEIVIGVEDPVGCHPHTPVFTDLTEPPVQQRVWDFGDPESSSNTATQQAIAHTFSAPGTYDISLQVTSAYGCVSDTVITQMVQVQEAPDASFTFSPVSADLFHPTITFTDQSSGNVSHWSWDFGDGAQDSVQHPSHTYQDTGYFSVTLIAYTDAGCADLARRNVTINPIFTFYVPDSFTPNGDGLNDEFRPYGEGVRWETYEMKIFNRWGQMIFFSKNVERGWNGKMGGADVEVGIYVYHISIFDRNDRQLTYNGRVNLIR